MDEMIKGGMSVSKASKAVFDIDIRELSASDVVVGVLDGNSIDEGVAIELGFAYALEIQCIGLQTDIRRQLPYGNNPMVENILDVIHNNINELIVWASDYEKEKPSAKLVYLKQ